MRIASFRIRDFRSISEAEVPLQDLTCLVGANNEGKSNILRAAVVATARMLGDQTISPYARRRKDWRLADFDPTRDLPRNRPNPKPSVDIELQLTDEESDAFHVELGHRINNQLRIRVDLLKSGPSSVRVIKQRNGPTLTDKSADIAEFIRNRLRLEYIPAVRTANQAIDIVQRLVADQLAVLRRDAEYRSTLERLSDLEAPVLAAIQDDLIESLSDFLPDLTSVTIERRGYTPGPTGSFFNMIVDDGVATDLIDKGDGVQSLAAIALARRAALVTDDSDHHLILAVEEPETHLHPAAVRRLRLALRDISVDHQVILTTHNPLLVDTETPTANILVEGQKARPADSVKAIRDCLGVIVADNLVSARLVVLVEGPGDVKVFKALLSDYSPGLRRSIDEGELVLEALGGASKLSAHAAGIRAAACSVYAVLDRDGDGMAAIETAVDSGRLSSRDYFMVGRPRMTESEFEDLVLLNTYKDRVSEEFDLNLNSGLTKASGPKWGDKFRGVMRSQSKLASDNEVAKAKWLISEAVAESGLEALNNDGRVMIESLGERLLTRITT